MLRRIAKHAWLVAVLTALPSLCSAQEKPFAMPLVPAANWRQVDSHPVPLASITKFGGDPVVEKEYGVKTPELCTYQLHKTNLQVVVEPASDATSAYGLLTFYRTEGMTPEKGIQLAVGDANQALMARGNKFIRFQRSDVAALSDSDFQALLIFVGGTAPSANALRELPQPMPSTGLVPGSEKYVVGPEAAKRVLPAFRTDLIGFDESAEVQLGNYQTVKGTSTLISISYPTPQIARTRFGSLTGFLGLNQDRGDNSIYGRREGSYVFLALKAGNPAAASSLLDRFKVSQGISWNQRYVTERSFTLQLVRMILAIFVLTAILIGACVIVGVLFFLSRRLAAKYFPESQWGRTDEDQLIRLNLKT